MTDCIFCKIIAGLVPADKVYQDDKIIAFRDIRPKARTHLLIVSKEHIKSLNDTKEEHSQLLAHMLLALPLLAKKEGLNNGFRTIINTGSGGGQEVDHIHFHLLGGGGLPGF